MNPQNNTGATQNQNPAGGRHLKPEDYNRDTDQQRQDAGTLYQSDRGITTDRNPTQGFQRDTSLNSGIGTRDGGQHFSGMQSSDTDSGLTGQRDVNSNFTNQQRTSVAQTDLGATGGAASKWSAEQDLNRESIGTDFTNQRSTGSNLTDDKETGVTDFNRAPDYATNRDMNRNPGPVRESLNPAGDGSFSTDFNRDRADISNADLEDRHDANRDPITGAPGAHPVGTGIGAASAGAVGAAIGAAGGPVGMAIGAAVGAVVGGLAGKATAEAVNPTEYDETYWRDTHVNEPHYDRDYAFDDYDPAYRYGTSAAGTYRGSRFEDVEHDLSRGWENAKGKSRLGWEKAKGAVRSAWDRAERAIPGDSDRDGK